MGDRCEICDRNKPTDLDGLRLDFNYDVQVCSECEENDGPSIRALETKVTKLNEQIKLNVNYAVSCATAEKERDKALAEVKSLKDANKHTETKLKKPEWNPLGEEDDFEVPLTDKEKADKGETKARRIRPGMSEEFYRAVRCLSAMDPKLYPKCLGEKKP